MMADDTVFDLLSDVQGLFNGVLAILEFIIGISYISGKYLINGILDAENLIVNFGKNIIGSCEIGGQVATDLFEGLLRTILLIYYGIGKIADAFYITFTDLVFFIVHAVSTILTFIQNSINLLISSIIALTIVPEQVCTALSLIGDFFLGFCIFLGNGALSILKAIVYTPILIFDTTIAFILYIITLPPKILGSIPPSAHIGLLVLIFIYFIYCRLSLRVFIRSSINLCSKTCNLFIRFSSTLLKFLHLLPKSSLKTPSPKKRRSKEGSGSHNLRSGTGGRSPTCVVCFEKEVEYLASPCNHICVCKDCCYELVKKDSRCPVCRTLVDSYSRVYLS